MIRVLLLSTALAASAMTAIAQEPAPPEGGAAAPAPATPLNPAATPVAGDAPAAAAGPRVGITAGMAEAAYTTPGGETVTVARDQAAGARLEGDWALVGRDCPPFCIQPMTPAPGVTTVGELELLEAMAAGDTILVDGRTPDWYAGGTIPGAVNIPYTQAVERLAELNCEPDFDGKFDCTDASKVIMFCNGPWCGQSPTAIRSMIDAGYPADRISYYRGGMQEWRLLGLTLAGGGAAAATDPIAARDVSPAEAATPGAGQQSAAGDGLAQNAGQAVPDAVTTPAENPVVEGTTEAAAADPGGEAPAQGEPTAATPLEGEQPADAATIDNAAKAGEPATPGAGAGDEAADPDDTAPPPKPSN